ncbi:MAG TPA: MFS transporter [Acidimicrobiia bacterium]
MATTDEPAADPTAAVPAAAGAPVVHSPVGEWPMWVLGFVIMLDQIDQYIVRGAATQIQAAFHISDLGIGVLLSAFVVVNGIVTVPAGYLADRWNRTRTIGHTVVAWSGITMVTAAAGNFATLVGLRALLGFGQAVTEPSAASLLSDYYPTNERGKVFSNQQIMGFVGAGLGIAIGGSVAATLGWRWAFLVVGFPGFLVALLCFRLREPPHDYADKLTLGVDEWTEPEKTPLFDNGFRAFMRDLVQGLRQDFGVIWSIPTMRYALVGISALMFTVSGVGAWLPKFHQLYSGMSAITAANVVGAVLIVGGVPGLLLGGRLADRYAQRVQGARVVIPAYCIWVGITFFTLSYVPLPGAASVALQVLGIFWVTMAIPALRAGLADAVPSQLRGAGFGAFNLASIVFGAAAAPILVGWLSDIWGLRAAFLVCSAPVYVGAYVLYCARTHLDEDAMKIFEAVVRAMEQEQARDGAS